MELKCVWNAYEKKLWGVWKFGWCSFEIPVCTCSIVPAWWIKIVKCTFVRLSYNIMPVNGIILSTPKTMMCFCAYQEMKSLLQETWTLGFPGLHAAEKSHRQQPWVRGPCVATFSSTPSSVTGHCRGTFKSVSSLRWRQKWRKKKEQSERMWNNR